MQKMNLCPNCEHPTVGTFLFAGGEIYCPSCGANGDIFFGKTVDATPELISKQAHIESEFKKARTLIHSGGGRLADCKKCNIGEREPHQYHLTDEEKRDNDRGWKMLDDMKIVK